MTTFEEDWAVFEKAGYGYGEDALENVRFGWEIARGLKPQKIYKWSELHSEQTTTNNESN